ncbi:MAG: PQQ-like beta-propeller repeat protein, partial [Planctomycetes bacterium]|nr:PQQ-like beta-propeller repeat protein [Planctomycetota bacterium]
KAHVRVFERAQNQLLAVKSVGDAKGDLTSTHVAWSHRRGLPSVPSPLVYEEVVYIVKNGGIVTSLGAADGGVLKQGRATSLGNYYASPVAGDGKVYLASEPGVITVLKAGGDWDILSYHDFGERIMATPTIVDGEVYVRTDDALYRFEKK